MDPNACLKELLALCATSRDSDDNLRLVELIESLDGWIVRGGHLPDRWTTLYGKD